MFLTHQTGQQNLLCTKILNKQSAVFPSTFEALITTEYFPHTNVSPVHTEQKVYKLHAFIKLFLRVWQKNEIKNNNLYLVLNKIFSTYFLKSSINWTVICCSWIKKKNKDSNQYLMSVKISGYPGQWKLE